MNNLTLYIGNKNYSSWSMRGWLLLKLAQADFKEVKFQLFTDVYSQEILKYSPSGKVPCLHDGDLMIWDTVAITEYLYEKFTDSKIYPADTFLRSIARSCIAEMHSGFIDLRSECPMNIKRIKAKNISQNASQDLKRIYQIWDFCKKVSGNKQYLLGDFGAIDAFFAPIVSRILSYGLEHSNHEDYIDAISNHAFFKEWRDEAIKETSVINDVELA
jgi:glutathione S-transferase